jgi:hypothetical protein
MRFRPSFLIKLALVCLGLTVVATGIALPVAKPRALVEQRTKTLAEGIAGPGFTKVVHADIPTQMVGFSWTGVEPGSVEIRAQRKGGWSDWREVAGSTAEGPDHDSKEFRGLTSAGPIWVGRGVLDVEVSVREGNLPNLKIHQIRSEEKTTPGVPSASAIPAMPGMIGRAGWGADESWRRIGDDCNGNPEYSDSVRFAVLHHTDTANNYGPGDSAAIVRGIYQFHTHTNRWCDIGYNFLVDRYGQIFEGRAGGVGNPVLGAHAAGFNTRSTGVAIIGEFQSTGVPGAAFDGTRRLLAWKLAHHRVNANSQTTVTAGSGSRWAPGTPVSIWTISGHRDVNNTACPGDFGHAMLPQLRREVQTTIASVPSFPAVVRNANWHLRWSQNAGPANVSFPYGNASDFPLFCDWNGDGMRTPGVHRGDWFYLRNSNSAGNADLAFPYGNNGDHPVCGDWDGDGFDTVGVVRSSPVSGNVFYLRNSNSGV